MTKVLRRLKINEVSSVDHAANPGAKILLMKRDEGSSGWIGVDLDGTLARYDGWRGENHIGEPIPAMVERVRQWIKDGSTVKIFTARVSDSRNRASAVKAIQDWLEQHGMPRLEVTNVKDFTMRELWDDRARQVIPNSGLLKRQQDNADLIDEGVQDLAMYFCEILADPQDFSKSISVAKLFKEFGDYLKAAVTPENDTPQSLSSKLNEMSSASGVPLEVLLHTARGARLLERLNELTKKEDKPMTTRSEEMVAMRKFVSTGGMSAVAKHILETGSTSLNEHEYTELVQENATQKGISFEKAFQDPDTQRAYKIVRDATQMQTYLKSFPNRMSLEVVSTETGSTLTTSDSFRAADQLKALVEAQRAKAPTLTTSELYRRVYADPANRTITERAHPRRSSTSGSELQR